MLSRNGSRMLKDPREFVDGGRFAAGNDEAVKAGQFRRPADPDAGRARGFDGVQVFPEVALQPQDADPQA